MLSFGFPRRTRTIVVVTRDRLVWFGWATLAFNVLVILMGAVVRATGSGAGCGRSYPTCQGRIIPELEGDTAIEFFHRGLSGIALVLVAILVALVFRRVERPDQVRVAAGWSMVAILGEAAIGAVIVLFEWVADDASAARAVSVPLHLVNTFVLLAALTITVHLLSGGAPLRPASHPGRLKWVLAGASVFALIAASGAVTALADTLFPKAADVGQVEHFLTELRVVHPVLAVVAVLGAAYALRRTGASGPMVGRLSTLVLIQMGIGLLLIAAGLPLWLRLLHLAVADVLWVGFVLAAAHLLAPEPAVR